MNLYYLMLSLDKTDRVVINLKVIATLKQGQRLCVRNNQFSVYDEGWAQALMRRLYSENRWINYEDVQSVMNEAFCILGTYSNLVQSGSGSAVGPHHSALVSVHTLCKEVRAAAAGLSNLKKTYSYDPLMVATLDVLTERADAEIGKASELLAKHHFAVVSPPPHAAPPLVNASAKPKPVVRPGDKDL